MVCRIADRSSFSTTSSFGIITAVRTVDNEIFVDFLRVRLGGAGSRGERAQNQALLSSTSWRMTALLRDFASARQIAKLLNDEPISSEPFMPKPTTQEPASCGGNCC